MTARWTVVTVTYGNADELRTWWPGVAEDPRFRWVVVDNASTDASVDVARSLGADVVELPCNVGFGAANNRGLAEVRTPWVAFANPDVRLDPDSFERLAITSQRFGALVAPRLTDPDGTPQPNGRGLPFPTAKLAHRGLVPFRRDNDAYVVPVGDEPTFVAWTMGAAIAGPTETVRRLGGWDERYFLYYEDHDLGLTAWRHGVPVIVDPGAVWQHEWKRATTGWSWTHWRHELRSGARFYAKFPELLLDSTRAHRRHDAARRWSGRVAEELAP